jgi:hypothetical protein
VTGTMNDLDEHVFDVVKPRPSADLPETYPFGF